MHRLETIDRLILQVEQDAHPMDLIEVWPLAPGPDGPVPFETVRALVGARLPEHPAYTRVVVQGPLGLGDAYWTTPPFDLDAHVSRLELPEPRDERSLLTAAASLGQGSLDRTRPLWHLWYAADLADGGCALVWQVHDTVTGGDATRGPGSLLLGPEPRRVEARRLRPAEVEAAPASAMDLVRRLAPDAARRQVTLAKGAMELGGAAVSGLADGARALPGALRRGRRPSLPSAPRTALDRSAGRVEKTLAFVTLPVADVERVSRASAGASIEDVVHATVAGALHSFLARIDTAPSAPLVAVCRQGYGAQAGGATPRVVELPAHLAHRAARLRSSRQKPRSTDRPTAPGASIALDFVHALLPNAVWPVLAQLARSRTANRVASPVNLEMGVAALSESPLYLGDNLVTHRFLRLVPVPPMRLAIQAARYADGIDVTVTGMADVLPDPEPLAALLTEELEALVRMVGRRDRRRADASGGTGTDKAKVKTTRATPPPSPSPPVPTTRARPAVPTAAAAPAKPAPAKPAPAEPAPAGRPSIARRANPKGTGRRSLMGALDAVPHVED